MQTLINTTSPLGLGCWPIGGAMFRGTQSLGYSRVDDSESRRTLEAALGLGITVFDTAAAYGAGHAERLLARAIAGRSDVKIISKIGIAIDETQKQLLGEDTDPDNVLPAIDACLARLKRDHLDVVLLHLNDLSPQTAEPLFDAMSRALDSGRVGSFGWSTDITAHVEAVCDRQGFKCVEYADNVLINAQRMRQTLAEQSLVGLIRSPLAMGLLSGDRTTQSVLDSSDVRAAPEQVVDYYQDARPNPKHLDTIAAITDLLTTGGRTLVQGALAWLWATSPRSVPVPGARTVTQIEGIAKAREFGPLSTEVIEEIETLMARQTDPADGTVER